jgi:hypothetical protein
LDSSYGDIGPTFSNTAVLFAYDGFNGDVRKVNFKNLDLHIFDPDGKLGSVVHLKNGKYTYRESDSGLTLGYEEVTLDAVHYLTGVSRSDEYALVLFSLFEAGGSSSSEEYAQVFELSDHRLRVVQQMVSDEHFGGPFPAHSYDPTTRTLVMQSAHYIRGDAHCCVSAVDVLTYRWAGNRFAQVSLKTDLTEYGRKAKKSLPR